MSRAASIPDLARSSADGAAGPARSRAARVVAPKGNRAQDRSELFDDKFLKTLEHLHMVSRKVFAGNLRAEQIGRAHV